MLKLYYVVRKYTNEGNELVTPEYKAGPFSSWLDADLHIRSEWLHNNAFAVVATAIAVEELLYN